MCQFLHFSRSPMGLRSMPMTALEIYLPCDYFPKLFRIWQDGLSQYEGSQFTFKLHSIPFKYISFAASIMPPQKATQGGFTQEGSQIFKGRFSNTFGRLPTPSVTHNAHTGQLMEFEVILLPPGVADAVSHRNTLREVQCFCLKIQQVALLHHNDNRHWPYI